MKTILLLLFFSVHLQATTIKLPDLTPENIAYLLEYHNRNPGPLTVKIEGERTFFQTIMSYGESFFEKADTTTGALDGFGLLKPILQWAVGSTVASYGAGFYFIYRAYKLLRIVGSWTSSANKQSEEELVLYIRTIQKKTVQKKYLKEIREEKEILEKYLKFHVYLCRWRIRKLFLYDKASHRSIVKSYKRLCALEERLCKTNK